MKERVRKMKGEQVLQLILAVSDSDLTEFKYEEDGVKLSLKKAGDRIVQVQAPAAPVPVAVAAPAPLAVTAPVTAASPAPVPAVQQESPALKAGVQTEEENVLEGKIVKSPLVGTFYAAPAEDAEPFIKTGDSVKEGKVLDIVEAMKLMNASESEFSGTVNEILVENGPPVEYGQHIL